jgi:hypothetical protein
VIDGQNSGDDFVLFKQPILNLVQVSAWIVVQVFLELILYLQWNCRPWTKGSIFIWFSNHTPSMFEKVGPLVQRALREIDSNNTLDIVGAEVLTLEADFQLVICIRMINCWGIASVMELAFIDLVSALEKTLLPKRLQQCLTQILFNPSFNFMYYMCNSCVVLFH